MMLITSGSRRLIFAAIGSVMICVCALGQDTQVKELSPAPSGYVMRFERMGGYAGVYDQFWIYPDGRVINEAGKTAKLPSGTVVEWVSKISPAASSSAIAAIPPPSPCQDCFVYRITVYDKDGTRVLSLADPLKDNPKTAAMNLGQIHDQLLRLFRK
ncbi:MAG: hypothetical protein ABSC02_10065 [Acidobacteriota bacterium]|jgi:hypothetical protein